MNTGLSIPSIFIICALLFIVSLLYSSVGHGGASGYLAVLSFFYFTPKSMASTALTLNLLVAGIAFISFYKAGYFSWRLTWPFLIASVPTAFAGGMIKISVNAYSLLLAVALLIAAFRLIAEFKPVTQGVIPAYPNLFIALIAGTIIGLASGIIGIGGGIFLSPLILLMRWADAKHTSGTCAFFILINSLAGLLARFLGANVEFKMLVPSLITAFLGGLIGSHLGANLFSHRTLRWVLGIVLVIASFKSLLKYLGG